MYIACMYVCMRYAMDCMRIFLFKGDWMGGLWILNKLADQNEGGE